MDTHNDNEPFIFSPLEYENEQTGHIGTYSTMAHTITVDEKGTKDLFDLYLVWKGGKICLKFIPRVGQGESKYFLLLVQDISHPRFGDEIMVLRHATTLDISALEVLAEEELSFN